jgi:type II secretion system protein I
MFGNKISQYSTLKGSHRNRNAFSLIEVLLALAIMLMALAAIGQLVGFGTEASYRARLTKHGMGLAESKMAEIECGAVSIDSASGRGNFDNDDSAWKWSCTVQPAGPPNLYQVTVTVSRDLRGQPFEIPVGRMLYDPAMMGSASQAEAPPATDPSTTTGSTTGATGTGGTSP